MIRTSELECAIRLVTEEMPDAPSVSIGFWVGTGSRDESERQAGVSHFLEHLLFKGTPTRSARSIAWDMDGVGGDMNAFTTKEYTAFYVRTLAEDIALALELLCDIMREPALRPGEVDAERQVILEEVLMHLDDPSDVVHERLAESLFPNHPLGREVLGVTEVIDTVSVDAIRAFFEEHYLPSNIVVAAAGRVEHDRLAAALEERFANVPKGARPERRAPGSAIRRLDVMGRETEQAHLAIGMRGPARRSPKRYALSLFNHTLGGGVSSRLFQQVREERGLAYSIGSERVAYSDCGALAVSVGTAPERVPEVLELIADELAKLAVEGVGEHELDLAKRHLKADTLLSLEDSGARMSRIGASLLLHDEVVEIEEVIERLDAVDLDEVRAIAAEILGGPRTLAVVGPFAERDFAEVRF